MDYEVTVEDMKYAEEQAMEFLYDHYSGFHTIPDKQIVTERKFIEEAYTYLMTKLRIHVPLEVN